MGLRFNRLTATILGAVIVLVILVVVLVTVVATRTSTAGKGHTGPYTIALSNSYIGNTWRVEMDNEFRASCAMAPLNKLVKCTAYNSGNDVSKQTPQIDNLISSRVDAILIDAASTTGLNGVIHQACSAGILVVSF